LNSCETPVTERVLAEITSRFGGVAVFQHEGKIRPADVEAAIMKLFDDLKGGATKALKEFINVLKPFKLNGVWQVTEVQPPPSELIITQT
jgi:hypothetical protein